MEDCEKTNTAWPHRGWFAGGCFWTTEALFERTPGVSRVIPGFVWLGPGVPIAQSVERFASQRIEAVEVHWDPLRVDSHTLVEVLMLAVSPTLADWETITEMSGLRTAALFEQRDDLAQGLEAIEMAKESSDGCQIIHTQASLLVPEFVHAPEQDWGFVRKRPNDGYSCSIVYPKLPRLEHLLVRAHKRMNKSTCEEQK